MIEIKDKKNCCGCHACITICTKHCITMHTDEEGFLYPMVDKDACIDCGLCEKVCPVINQNEPRKPLKVYAAKTQNEDIRRQSSSGGIFTLLAEKVIDEGGVVFGARFDKDWNVIHSWTDTVEGIAAFRGSKYVQSTIGDTYREAREFIKKGRKVLFSGTPCQIAGLKKFLRKDYDNLFTVDVVCHGVPSPLVWHTYLNEICKQLCIKNSDGNNTHSSSLDELPVITGVSFRDKTNGWKKFCLRLNYAPKNTVCTSTIGENVFLQPLTDNIFMHIFIRNLSLRPSCYDCPSKGFKSCSDITLADFWGIELVDDDFKDDKGCSLVIENTDKGCAIIGILDLYKKGYEQDYAFKYNPSVYTSVKTPDGRNRFWKAMMKGNELSLCLIAANPTLIERILNKIKKYIKR